MELRETASPFVQANWETILGYGSPPHGGFAMDVTVSGMDSAGQMWWYILGLAPDGNAYRWLAPEGGAGQPCEGIARAVHGHWHSDGPSAVWDTDGDGQGQF